MVRKGAPADAKEPCKKAEEGLPMGGQTVLRRLLAPENRSSAGRGFAMVLLVNDLDIVLNIDR